VWFPLAVSGARRGAAMRGARFGALVVVLLGGLSGPTGAQGKLEARYTASVAGIVVGRGTWVIDIGTNQYTAAASGRVVGLLKILANAEGTVAAHGTIEGGRLWPASYSSRVTADDKVDDIRLAFTAGVITEAVAEPPTPPSADRVPISEAHRRGVFDPMTAELMPVGGSGDPLSPEACRRTLPIFDGRQRFDLTLTFKRFDHVKAEKGYQGPVVVCMVSYQPIAGHRPGRAAIKYLMATREMEMWLAPIAGTRVLVPFRASVPTLIGQAVLEATQFVTVPQAAPANSASLKTD
jgi:Protein of unknown function (DUF3108)